ncbi:SRPBCC family protein [Streptomyces sp. NP160]|uniref:SRPBCC family protein n=1 Tax=Streptomyces sp. NP160 TaxID=2586637 RepID=UPI001119F811|nr:SRPBCC family protein [Streptomyces sp. NP160]TNM68505.1 SRPBCC family protein [Streptomyces sp. NP160]
MPTIEASTDLPGDVATVLDVSLDLDVELAAGRRHRVHPVPAGPGSRTSGRIGAGERVRWSLRLYGVVPLRHTTQILEVTERTSSGGASFVDAMVSGAFSSFRHEHLFTPLPAAADGSPRTRSTDRMTWTSPLGPLGRLADAVLVRRTLVGLLADRNAEIARRLGA